MAKKKSARGARARKTAAPTRKRRARTVEEQVDEVLEKEAARLDAAAAMGEGKQPARRKRRATPPA